MTAKRHRHLCIVIGRVDEQGMAIGSWKLENGRLYRMRACQSSNGKIKWRNWKPVGWWPL